MTTYAKVNVILLSGTPAIRAAQKATRAIPTVFIVRTEPLALEPRIFTPVILTIPSLCRTASRKVALS